LIGVGVGVGACNSAAAELDAAALDLPTIQRPGAATQGAAKAFLGPFAGDVTLTAANGASIDAAAGAPLLGDDRLHVAAGGLAVVLFTNGKVLRVEGEFDQAIRDLAGFGDPPGGADLEVQLRGALSKSDRERLVASSERIGGWQLRLKALDGVAAEEADLAAVPMSEPAKDDAAKTAADPKPEPKEEADEEGLPGAGGEEKEPKDPVVGDGGGDGRIGAGGGDTSAGYGGVSKPPPPQQSKRPPPSTETASAPTTKNSESRPLDAGLRDEQEKTGEETGKKSKSSRPPWSFSSAKWTTGDAVALPTKLRGSIISCLRTLQADDATVDITVDAGTIKKLEIRGVSTLKCVEEYAGWTLTGVSGSGTIRAIFRRK
ncbi:MAG: hypothetical protein KC486_14860, partial [Myxococcales bacterium]|nr:hypothetical protein [Myxococcales bacterium]